ncbi:uncharacterized mitochondrial protein AtMg00860-like [Benincasa hispida]|uniref:uncharacterized mitochondrial protein AtMg00860-like n=1 Tax=Benincasa hispida TaxID=102211 RepID=UPI00190090DB|nr:uncharacterized mitochondrial protein AtMg00860-like [Benincasa hispida]
MDLGRHLRNQSLVLYAQDSSGRRNGRIGRKATSLEPGCEGGRKEGLEECVTTNLVLNWEKCHFMVDEGIVLSHKISKVGLEVDQAKIDAISKLSPQVNVKTLRSLLGHAEFYRRFIRNFSQITRPLSALLEADREYNFDDVGTKAFNTLKDALITAPILVATDWM